MKRHRAPLLAAALAATLVLASCGSEEPAANPNDSLPAPDDDGLLPPRPVQIATAGNEATSARAAGTAMDAASELSIAPWGPVEYVVDPNLPALPTNDIGYVYEVGTPVTEEQVAQLAATFGVSGEPVRVEQDFGAYWRVGPEDGSAPALWVYDDALQSWNYTPGYEANGDAAVSCMVDEPAVAPTEVSTDTAGAVDRIDVAPVCAEPTPPEGVPTAADAEARARETLVALGLDPDAMKFDTYADVWYASVTATESLDGNAPGKSWSFGYGADAALQHASGQLATAAAVGPYPLVDLETALARLAEQQSGFGTLARGGVADAGFGVAEPAVSGPAETEAGVVATVEVGEPLPVDVPEGEVLPVEPVEPIDPMPMPAPLPEGEPVIVTLVDVEADLWWVWDTDGAVWMLPAYRFIDTDGGWHVVPAVTDEFMIQVEQPAIEPMPVDPPVAVDPAPGASAPEPTLVDPAMFDAGLLDEYIGLPFPEFEAKAEELGASVRVAERDGEPLALTMDLQFNRVNVAVVTDAATGVETVTAIHSVG